MPAAGMLPSFMASEQAVPVLLACRQSKPEPKKGKASTQPPGQYHTLLLQQTCWERHPSCRPAWTLLIRQGSPELPYPEQDSGEVLPALC